MRRIWLGEGLTVNFTPAEARELEALPHNGWPVDGADAAFHLLLEHFLEAERHGERGDG